MTPRRFDLLPVPGPWAAAAACLHTDPDLWFPGPGPGSSDDAVAVCATCPVQAECLAYALRWRIEHGVWGGTSEVARRRLLRRRLTVVV